MVAQLFEMDKYLSRWLYHYLWDGTNRYQQCDNVMSITPQQPVAVDFMRFIRFYFRILEKSLLGWLYCHFKH